MKAIRLKVPDTTLSRMAHTCQEALSWSRMLTYRPRSNKPRRLILPYHLNRSMLRPQTRSTSHFSQIRYEQFFYILVAPKIPSCAAWCSPQSSRTMRKRFRTFGAAMRIQLVSFSMGLNSISLEIWRRHYEE